MSEHIITVGLCTIGSIRETGRQFEAWAEPGRKALGRFNTYEQACRAVYQRDIEQRVGGA